ncbi:MAG: endonuclease III domain-containing protein [Thermodesulfobacteriota bacterium]
MRDIYAALYDAFGPQHWWPADTVDEIVIGAVLAQNVAWRNVENAIAQLKAHRMLTLSAIAEADVAEIAPLIHSTRFYNQKAGRLKALTRFLHHHGQNGDPVRMLQQPTGWLRAKLLALKGFGEETVDSILLYAGGHPVFVIDAYTRRICARAGLAETNISYNRLQQFFMDRLPADTALYNDYHAQLVYLGNTCCKKNKPRCHQCPIDRYCSQILDH